MNLNDKVAIITGASSGKLINLFESVPFNYD